MKRYIQFGKKRGWEKRTWNIFMKWNNFCVLTSLSVCVPKFCNFFNTLHALSQRVLGVALCCGSHFKLC